MILARWRGICAITAPYYHAMIGAPKAWTPGTAGPLRLPVVVKAATEADLDYFPHTHHTNQDTYDHLIPDDLKQASVVVASFVYDAAMRDQKLPRKPLPAAKPQ